MRKKPPEHYDYCYNSKVLYFRRLRVKRALVELGARVWHDEVDTLHRLRRGEKVFGPLPHMSVFEQLADVGKNEEKLAELEKKARKFRKLKRAAKKRGVDFDEYVLWAVKQQRRRQRDE